MNLEPRLWNWALATRNQFAKKSNSPPYHTIQKAWSVTKLYTMIAPYITKEAKISKIEHCVSLKYLSWGRYLETWHELKGHRNPDVLLMGGLLMLEAAVLLRRVLNIKNARRRENNCVIIKKHENFCNLMSFHLSLYLVWIYVQQMQGNESSIIISAFYMTRLKKFFLT